MSEEKPELTVRVETEILAIPAAGWDACANPPNDGHSKYLKEPFLSHDFLSALEQSGSVGGRTGWSAQHIVLEDTDGAIKGVMPCYLKSHSQGEYIFDQGWADAFMRAGGTYYPKLLSAVPFTPVTGGRVLALPGPGRRQAQEVLLSAAMQLTERHGLSSFHINFLREAEWTRFKKLGFLQRTDQQFMWLNDGYANFDEFLGTLASRKRKAFRRERRQAVENDIEIDWITGGDLTEDHWDRFFEFYIDTGSRKWGSPYLTREFFSLIGERMADHILLVMCRRGGDTIAGALNIIGADALYGRYWGCLEDHRFLHFETCYYQAIDFAIAHGLQRVEAGAGGTHKLSRGYLPATTYSLHYIANPSFRQAIADYLDDERDYVAHQKDALCSHSPFRKDDL